MTENLIIAFVLGSISTLLFFAGMLWLLDRKFGPAGKDD